MNRKERSALENLETIYTAASKTTDPCLGMVSPHPKARERLRKELEKLNTEASPLGRRLLRFRRRKAPGLNDGLIYPPRTFPIGTPLEVIRSVARHRAPISGTVNAIVVLVDFPDKQFPAGVDAQTFEDIFFKQGNNSVRDYFDEVSNGTVTLAGKAVGPYRLSKDITDYANGDSGIGSTNPNAKDMAREAVEAANADVDYSSYDNDGDGYVDAFIVVHAGQGAESTLDPDDIWSHKWNFRSVFSADGTNVYSYLTVPEDASMGLCCHELGHLLFGLPDLYDYDDSSEGVGHWCLMGSGNWLDNGDTPGHLCAWAKADLGWVSVVNVQNNGTFDIADVKTGHTVYRLWKDGAAGTEYFLVENRQKTGFDAHLDGEGLLIWHVDESIADNDNELHPKVYLEQGDGQQDLDDANNRGDGGDSWPGTSNATTFNNSSTPNSQSYAGTNTCVAVENIPASAAVMTTTLKVKCGPDYGKLHKDMKDMKDGMKEHKEIWKEPKEFKEPKELKDPKEFKEPKERKEFRKELKDVREPKDYLEPKDFQEPKDYREPKDYLEPKDYREPKDFHEKSVQADKQYEKTIQADKNPEKPDIDKSHGYDKRAGMDKMFEKPAEFVQGGDRGQRYGCQPFIGEELRPDLSQSALRGEEDVESLRKKLQLQGASAKRSFDTKTREY